MAWDEVVAALLGGLEGGVEGWQFAQKSKRQDRDRKAQEARQAEEDALRAEQREWQREDRQERTRDRERRDSEDLLTSLGRDAFLSPEQAARVGRAGLDHRVRPEETLATSFFSTDADGEIARTAAPGRPTGRMMVAATSAERRADQAVADKARAAAAERAQLLKMINALPTHLQPAAQFGAASGKMPTFGADDYPSPEQRAGAKASEAAAVATATLPIKLRERESEKAIDRRYATMPVPTRDDPAMPQGVRSYLGDLVSRYQSDPAGARAELQRAAPSLLRDHPNLDLVRVTQQMNAMLPLPQLTDEEKDAAAQQRAVQRPSTPPVVASGAPPAAAKVPIPMAGQPRPDARTAQASALMKQIQQGRAQGQDTTALEQQLLALKRGTGAAVVH